MTGLEDPICCISPSLSSIPCSSTSFTGWRRKLLKLGSSFFLFGLINNGECPHVSCVGAKAVVSSSICHHPLRCTRPSTTIYSQRHHRILQHISCIISEARLAVFPQRKNTVRPAHRGVRTVERRRHAGACSFEMGDNATHSVSRSLPCMKVYMRGCSAFHSHLLPLVTLSSPIMVRPCLILGS